MQKKKNDKITIDKSRIITKIIAMILAGLMVLSIAATFIMYLFAK